jgi:hypothetical protein
MQCPSWNVIETPPLSEMLTNTPYIGIFMRITYQRRFRFKHALAFTICQIEFIEELSESDPEILSGQMTIDNFSQAAGTHQASPQCCR